MLVDADRGRIHALQEPLVDVATQIDCDHIVVVNFAGLPNDEFEEKKSWYPYFSNIDKEGKIIYDTPKEEAVTQIDLASGFLEKTRNYLIPILAEHGIYVNDESVLDLEDEDEDEYDYE